MGIGDYSFSSRWRDISIFTEMGIPAMTYGPGVALRGSLSMRISHLVTAAKVYADLATASAAGRGPSSMIPSWVLGCTSLICRWQQTARWLLKLPSMRLRQGVRRKRAPVN